MNMEYLKSDNQFYPTPPELAAQMMDGIDWKNVHTVLEPSAGKGDLILAASRARDEAYLSQFRSVFGYRYEFEVDAVEIDPYLREILKFNFSPEGYKDLTEARQSAGRDDYEKLRTEEAIRENVALSVIHDDFLTLHNYKKYDLIIMNPPFENGDKHLMKALDLIKDGGNVVCLLNAETIRNPYSNVRKELGKKLRDLEAQIDFVENSFSNAERKTDVEVAIVRVSVPEKPLESTIWERMEKAMEEEEPFVDPEINALVPGGFIERAIHLYNVEVRATLELVREFRAFQKHTARTFDGDRGILSLQVCKKDYGYTDFDFKKYMRAVRYKYWKELFNNPYFIGKLTSNLHDQFLRGLDRMAEYDFTAFNIRQVSLEMNAMMQQGVKDTIMKLFETLSAKHSWYPECSENIHYYNGWKTNKAHKVGMKCIIPGYSIVQTTWDNKKEFNLYEACKILGDIEKAFDYLDGNRTETRYSLTSFVSNAIENGKTRNIPCTYFTIDLYKKGTVHIKFRPEAQSLVDKLNIYAAQGKNWLPPRYGKVSYADMTEEEQAVIDEFQGAEEYAKVMSDTEYYLTDPAAGMLMLGAE